MYKMNAKACEKCNHKFCQVCGIAQNIKEDEENNKKSEKNKKDDVYWFFIITAIALVALFLAFQLYHQWDVMHRIIFLLACGGGFMGVYYKYKYKFWWLFSLSTLAIVAMYVGEAIYQYYCMSVLNKSMFWGGVILFLYEGMGFLKDNK